MFALAISAIGLPARITALHHQGESQMLMVRLTDQAVASSLN
jgi:hypothetical protein